MNKNNIEALAVAIATGIATFLGVTNTNTDEAGDEILSNTDVSGQLDAAGFPWDERIHSSTKTRKDDGTWTAKRGAKNLIASVEAELRAAGYGVVTAAPIVAAPIVAAPVIAAPIVAAPVIAVPVTEYSKLCDLIASNSDKLNPAWVQNLFESNGVTGGLPSLAGDEVRSKAFHDGILSVLPE